MVKKKIWCVFMPHSVDLNNVFTFFFIIFATFLRFLTFQKIFPTFLLFFKKRAFKCISRTLRSTLKPQKLVIIGHSNGMFS